MNRRSSGVIDLESIHDSSTTNDVSYDTTAEEDLFTIDKLRATLKPLIVSMRVFGLLHGEVFWQEKVTPNSVVPSNDDIKAKAMRPMMRKSCIFDYGFWFCLLATLLVWACCAYVIISIFVADTFMGVLSRLFMFLWFSLCACQQLACLLTISKRTKLSPLSRFDKFVDEFILVSGRDASHAKKLVRIATIVGWTLVTCNTTIMMISFHNPNQNIRNNAREMILGKLNSEKDLIIYIYSPIHVLLGGIWCFPTCFYIVLCLLVADRFEEVFERASRAIKKKNINLASLRMEHVQLCHVVSTLDDILSVLGLISFAVYIPLICLGINICIVTFAQASVIDRVGYIFWISSNATVLLVSSIAGARVNNSAYRLSEVLYDIKINDLDSKSELELMLLLSNLNGNYTGLTIGGVVTITKEMILTVFGTIVGYLTILISFK